MASKSFAQGGELRPSTSSIPSHEELQALLSTNLQDSLPSQAQSKGQVLILCFLGRIAMPVLEAPQHSTAPLSGHPFVLPISNKLVVPHLFPSSPTGRNKGQQSLMVWEQGIWGLVYYMLNRALNYWWLLPSLTAFLKKETWENKYVSWKKPYSDKSWQEQKHPGFTAVYLQFCIEAPAEIEPKTNAKKSPPCPPPPQGACLALDLPPEVSTHAKYPRL